MSVALSPECPENKEGIKLFYAKDKVCLELISKKKKEKKKKLCQTVTYLKKNVVE